jgi:hypothetical protein
VQLNGAEFLAALRDPLRPGEIIGPTVFQRWHDLLACAGDRVHDLRQFRRMAALL